MLSDYAQQGTFFSYNFKKCNMKFDFLGDDIKVFINGKFIKLMYGKSFTFYLSDGEYAKSAYELIAKVFHRGKIIIIGSNKNALREDYILKSNDQYIVIVQYPIKFKEKGKDESKYLYLDYLSTVYDAQKILAEKIHAQENLHPENFILFDDNKEKVKSTIKQLRRIHGLGHVFHYEIDRSKKGTKRQSSFEHSLNSSKKQLRPKFEMDPIIELFSEDSSERPSNRPKSVENKQKSKDKNEMPSNRSKSVQKELKPNIKNDSKLLYDSESLESDSQKPKKVSKKRFMPSVVPVNLEKSSSPLKKRSKSAQNPRTVRPDQQEQKLPIRFVFEIKENSRPTIILKKIPIKMTIKEVQEYLVNDTNFSFIIDYDITFKYKYKKRKISLDQDKTIEEVQELIKDPTEKTSIKNVIYVEPAPKRKIIARPKLKQTVNNDDDDDKYSLDFSPKNKKLRKKANEKEEKNATENLYEFQYNKTNKELLLYNDSRLNDNEKQIKEAFKLNLNEKVYYYILDEDGDKKRIQNLNQKMKIYQKNIIYLYIPQKIKPELTKIKYFYQTNRKKVVSSVELDQNATVLTMKQKIAEIEDIEDLANIKIIFAGKELLDDILLEPLNIGDTLIFVYIRYDKSVLLLTAKALKNT